MKLVTVTCNFLNGKNIRKRSANGSEEGSWWETGQVMDCETQDISRDFTVKFLMKAN